MEELKKMYTETEENLYKKGFFIENMINDSEQFELSDLNGNILIDHLSLTQLFQLSKIL